MIKFHKVRFKNFGSFGNNFTEVELDAHVHDGDDDAAQVHDALDEVGRIGDAGHGFVAADFLNLQNIDAVFFLAQGEGEKFVSVAVGLFAEAGKILGCSVRHVEAL